MESELLLDEKMRTPYVERVRLVTFLSRYRKRSVLSICCGFILAVFIVTAAVAQSVNETIVSATQEDLEAKIARANYLLAVSRWRENRLADSYGLLYDIPQRHRNVEWHLLKFLLEGSDQTFYGHASMVYSVSCSPDGVTIASGDVDSNIRIWNLETGDELCSLRGHRGDVNCVAFSPVGTTLASAADDSTIKLWDAASGQLMRTISTRDEISCIDFSPDGLQLAGASSFRLFLWDLKTGEEIRSFNTLKRLNISSTPSRLVFSSDGLRIASTLSRDIIIWEPKSDEDIRILSDEKFDVEDIAFGTHGNSLVSASVDGTVQFWDVETGKPVRSFHTGQGAVYSLGISPDETQIATGDYDGTIKLFEAKTGKKINELRGHFDLVKSVVFGPEGSFLISGSRDRLVKRWNLNASLDPNLLLGEENADEREVLSPDNSLRTLTTDDHLVIQIQDAKSGQIIRTLPRQDSRVNALAFFPDGTKLASGLSNDSISIWDLKTGAALKTFQSERGEISSLAVSPDGVRLAALMWIPMSDSTLTIWNCESGKEVYSIRIPGGEISRFAFSVDGSRLAGSDNSYYGGHLTLWDASTGEELVAVERRELRAFTTQFTANEWPFHPASKVRNETPEADAPFIELLPLRGHTGRVFDVIFSPDGSRIATTSQDGSIKLWDSKTANEIYTVQTDTLDAYDIAFSPNGTVFISWGESDAITFWDVATGKAIRTINDPNGVVECAIFSGDSAMVATGTVEGRISIWDAGSGRAVQSLQGSERGLSVTALAFDAAGKRLVSASYGAVKVWDVEKGTELVELRGPEISAFRIGFSSDEKRVFAHGFSYTLASWDVDTGNPVTDDAEFPDYSFQVRSPDGQWLAIPAGKIVLLIGRKNGWPR